MKKKKGTGPSDVIVVRIKRPKKDNLAKLAEERNTSMSDLIRESMLAHLGEDYV